MTDLQTRVVSAAVQKARETRRRLREQGCDGPPETVVLSVIFELDQRIKTLEARLAAQDQAASRRAVRGSRSGRLKGRRLVRDALTAAETGTSAVTGRRFRGGRRRSAGGLSCQLPRPRQ